MYELLIINKVDIILIIMNKIEYKLHNSYESSANCISFFAIISVVCSI